MSLPPLIPREVLFGNPDRTNVRISPDGSKIAYLAPKDGVQNVWVRSFDGEDDHPVTSDTHRGIPFFDWSFDGKSIFFERDKDGDENWHIFLLNTETLEVRDLTPFEAVQARFVACDHASPNEVLIALNKEQPEIHDVFKIYLETGESEVVLENPGNLLHFTADPQLKIRAATGANQEGGYEVYAVEDDGSFRNLISAPFGESIFAFYLTPDEKGLYLSSTIDSDTSRVLVLDIASGEQTVISERKGVDFDGGVIAHPTKRHIQALSYTYARKEWVFLDPDLEADFKKASHLDKGEFDLVSRDLSDRWWVVAFTQDVNPVKYYLYNRETGEGRYMFSQNKAQEEAELASMKPLEITTRDGLTMVCYLTLPVGVDHKNLPLVLNVHGGPWHRDSWGLDSEAQWLANRGYAVLQVNFRGSTGFGKSFVNAANKEWGGKMHDDLIDAVNWAKDSGIADPKKIGILGWSYGGYATMVGMTFTPDVFAVGVAGVGISNLVSWAHSIPAYWKLFLDQLYLRVGNPETEEEFLKSRSPLFKVDQIKNPILIGQGANDPRVPQAESDQIVEALRSSGREVEYMLFEDEGHGFARPENRLKFYQAAEKFLSKALGGRFED